MQEWKLESTGENDQLKGIKQQHVSNLDKTSYKNMRFSKQGRNSQFQLNSEKYQINQDVFGLMNQDDEFNKKVISETYSSPHKAEN